MDIRDIIEQTIKPQVRQPLWESWYIKEKIGSGSFSVVYRMEAERQDGIDEAALKIEAITADEVISGDETRRSTVLKRKLDMAINETRIMKQLRDCVNVVRYEDELTKEFEISEHSKGYYHLIRMEYLKNVYEQMKAQAFDYSEQNVRKLALDIAHGLQAAHRIGVIHRDVKPDNMFISASGIYKIGDFNISKKAVSTRSFAGSNLYMAPEVFRAKSNADDSYSYQADIYSLGLCLYQMMNNGLLPFEEDCTADDAHDLRMSGKPFPAPCNASSAFAGIIMKACAFDRSVRYPSFDEMIAALTGETAVSSFSAPARSSETVYADESTQQSSLTQYADTAELPVSAPADNARQREQKAAPAARQSEQKVAPAVKQSEQKAAPAVKQSEQKAAPAVKQSEQKAAPAAKQLPNAKERNIQPAKKPQQSKIVGWVGGCFVCFMIFCVVITIIGSVKNLIQDYLLPQDSISEQDDTSSVSSDESSEAAEKEEKAEKAEKKDTKTGNTTLTYQFTPPDDISGLFRFDFVDAADNSILQSSELLNSAYTKGSANGSVRTSLTGTGKKEIYVSLVNLVTNKTALLGSYTFDFENHEIETEAAHPDLVFNSVGGLTVSDGGVTLRPGVYTISNKEEKASMEFVPGNPEQENIVLNSTGGQQFFVEYLGSGFYRIILLNDNGGFLNYYCKPPVTAGVDITLWPQYDNDSTQQFYLEKSNFGTYLIKSVDDRSVVLESWHDDSGRIRIHSAAYDSGAKTQLWKFEPV